MDDDVTLFQLSPLFFTPPTPVSIPHRLFVLSAFLPPAAAFVTRPFFSYLPFFSPFLSSLSALSQHTSLRVSNPKTAPLSRSPHLILCSIPPSIHHPPTLSLSLSFSLVSPCCGLCLPSLSELLSLLSAPLARTKSSSAHGTTKDTREIKGKSLSQKKKRGKEEKLKRRGVN